jgi:hypothetical protein
MCAAAAAPTRSLRLVFLKFDTIQGFFYAAFNAIKIDTPQLLLFCLLFFREITFLLFAGQAIDALNQFFGNQRKPSFFY